MKGNIIGRVLLIDNNDTYVYNQRVERLQLDLSKYNASFIYYVLNFDKSKIIKRAQGATQIYVNWLTIKNIKYNVPFYDEQIKLGKLFNKFDQIINLQTRKINLLKKQKKKLF